VQRRARLRQELSAGSGGPQRQEQRRPRPGRRASLVQGTDLAKPSLQPDALDGPAVVVAANPGHTDAAPAAARERPGLGRQLCTADSVPYRRMGCTLTAANPGGALTTFGPESLIGGMTDENR
jgi:hypothetical protein